MRDIAIRRHSREPVLAPWSDDDLATATHPHDVRWPGESAEVADQARTSAYEPKGEITMRKAFAINYVTHDGDTQSPGAFQ